MKLNTWEFGNIRVVGFKEITILDRYIRDDILGKWSFYQLADNYGEIVAVHNWED